MTEASVHPRVIFPAGFDTRAEQEMPEKGWIETDIELPGGAVYHVRFVDAANLLHDLKLDLDGARGCFAEPALAVVPVVTVDTVRAAAQRLWENGTFDDLAPSAPGLEALRETWRSGDAEPAIVEYNALGPSNFRLVDSIAVRQSDQQAGWECSLEIRLRHIDPREDRRLVLSFGGVIGLRLAPPTRMIIQYVNLDISSVRGRGWGAVNYAVRDVLAGSISLLSRELKVSEG